MPPLPWPSLDDSDQQAMWLTLRLAVAATAVLLAVATPLAWWLARGGGWARRAVRAVVALPLVLPPTALGLYLLEGMGPQTALGRGLIALLGHPLAFSFGGLLAGSVVYSLPFAVQPLTSGFEGMEPLLLDTARSLGASAWQAFRFVQLPLARGSFVTAAVLCFCHTVGEFGVVLMIGGNLPGATRTLSIALFDRAQEGNYAAANAIAWMLLLVSFIGLMAVYLQHERGRGLAGVRRWRRLA